MDKNIVQGKNAVSRLLSIPLVTSEIVLELYRKNKKLYDLKRTIPPTKGCFVAMQLRKGTGAVEKWVKTCKEEIVRAIEKQAQIDVNYRTLLIMEEFQFNQKGPVAPIEKDQLIMKVIPKIYESASHIITDQQVISDLARARSKLIPKIERLRSNHLTIEQINYADWFSQLPSDSVRGLPFLEKGKYADEKIIKTFGTDFKKVWPKFSAVNWLVSTAGLRFQGSAPGEVAKVRLINIPGVYYVYLMNGIYKYLQTILKNWDCMAAWLPPEQRDKTIVKMVSEIEANGWSILPLDYRGYDQHLPPFLRFMGSELAFMLLPDSKGKVEVLNHLKKIYQNQWLCAPWQNEPLSLIPVPTLLASGIPNTQLDGSLINFILQHYIAMKLGYDIPDNWGLALGDDTGLPIPNQVMEKLGGYDKTLEYIKKELLNPMFMDSHDKKAYPEPKLLFLQKLYSPSEGIIGEYSIVRSIDSLVYSEQYRKSIEGVNNLNALETIGQITVMNNPMTGVGSTSLKRFMPLIIKRWLQVDPALLKLAKLSSNSSEPENVLFRYLIGAAGGRAAVVQAMRLDKYDHKGDLDRMKSSNYKETFPVLTVIINVSKSMLSSDVSLFEVYGCKFNKSIKQAEVENGITIL